ncbi:Putative ABC-type transport system involved in lysophospholipase L1 biosynthesis, ATPase component [Neorhizobium galegae bv. officinalis bv. officinalis str. HAMBI 1141]|uniref:Putative ABC-type transport system involved in lysophospholipase L1 biosynthesis, ATPase component n=1 Tax=Neorhizobium galegae bv. officinalis bv. officinalis str. HAMBI 1141 TaxID=1028801 RepID=A0A068TEQ4_NEOGA|nr:ATP-binding cassette domain-containing protein [Neorhizobium galegae]CDN56536.1 Putative ABC-type transport system involved in lysophospholipase L1 biosynthesis, ATPase component [Neorhizobium galegae bv. officinalis bv. officinalis str. HAMBI 1141]
MLSLRIDNLAMSFPGLNSPVLLVDFLTIAAGERVAVTGGSGSGKSTFINVITGLERPTSGKVVWSGEDVARLSETARDRWRAEHVGLVMQDLHLFPGLSAVENVLLPARLARVADAALIVRAHDLLKSVGLSRPGQKIETMSRGEMQRVAIARAVLRKPGVIVADEPTASLDVEAGETVGRLLLDMSGETGSTLIVVSHDQRLIDRLDRRITLGAGRIISDSFREEVAA